jgi:ABC-type nitrate/sulfonate/bicarbonate transport system substrate-binding protein
MTAADHQITAGFMPLLDSALLIVGHEMGFAADEGVALSLVRESSWANIRDRIAVGHFDVAHMLAPMPIAAALNLSPLAVPVIAPMALGLGGNAVTVSRELWHKMADAGAPGDLNATVTGAALKRVIDRGGNRLRLGVVHPHSVHNYELRYWLAASGIDPEQQVEIVILPPSLLPEALAQGSIDGYCVGEPWNSVGVAGGARIATVKAAIWRSSPEKVLGATEQWAMSHGEALAALVRALYRAAEWTGNPVNHAEAADILARPDYLNMPAKLIRRGLTGEIDVGGQIRTVPDFFLPFSRAATFPWQSHALWFYSQMVRWGQVRHHPAHALRAASSYRPDLYRSALSQFAVAVPGANSKVEGALVRETPVGATRGSLVLGPDGFFDGRIFDPAMLDTYLNDDDHQK